MVQRISIRGNTVLVVSNVRCVIKKTDPCDDRETHATGCEYRPEWRFREATAAALAELDRLREAASELRDQNDSKAARLYTSNYAGVLNPYLQTVRK